jgi:hypothetical protein
LNIEKVIALHRYATNNRSKLYKVGLIAHSIYLLLFKKYTSTIERQIGNSKSVFVFFKAMHRFDYDRIFSLIASACPFEKIIINSKISYGFDFSFLTQPLVSFNIFNKIDGNDIFERTYFFLSYLFYTKALKIFDQIDLDVVVVFADMQPVDNIIVQYFNKLGKASVTLQHGLFVDYEGVYNISSVQYKSVVSDYFLTWGESNKTLIERHNNNCKVVICGNPSIEPYVDYDESIPHERFFTVILDWDVFEKENKEMIEIAKVLSGKLNLKYHVRLHPSNKKNKYKINSEYAISNKNIDFMLSDFIFGHTSSVIHIADRLGRKVYKYKTNVPTNPIDDTCLIIDAEDMYSKICNANIETDNFIKETVNIGPIGKDSLHRYKSFFVDTFNKTT